MENSCRKKYKPSPKIWILASSYPEFRRNSALIPANAGLFHYAGNNPVRYIDPDGRTEVYFLYEYKNGNQQDQDNRESELPSIQEELGLLKKHLVSYEVISSATASDLTRAFSDEDAVMIVISGHGADAAFIETADEGSYTPDDVPKISSSLGIVIFENCYQGGYISEWRNSMSENVTIVGWEGTTSVPETIDFNNAGVNSRQARNLESYIKEAILRAWSNKPIEYRQNLGKEPVHE